MNSALDEYLELSYHTYKWSQMTLIEQANLREKARAELAELRAALEEARKILYPSGQMTYRIMKLGGSPNKCENDIINWLERYNNLYKRVQDKEIK